jgi:hypothetical protein
VKQYIKQIELDAMPLEPRARFVAIYELANERFDEEIASIDGREDWHRIETARVRFAATMIGFAKSLGIHEVAKADFPAIRNAQAEAFESFELNLGHVTAQYMTDTSMMANLESVELRGSARERLQVLAAAMREQVETLDLTSERKDVLRRHIEAFERELLGGRLSLVALAKLAVGISLAVGGLAQGAVAFLELHDRLVRAVAEEKNIQDHERVAVLQLISIDRPAATLAISDNRPPGPRESFSADLDDEIPF